MTVREKADVDFIGYTTNAALVGLTIPVLSRLTQQIALRQTSWREHSCLLLVRSFLFLFCKYLVARRKKEKSCSIVYHNFIRRHFSFVSVAVYDLLGGKNNPR